MDDSSSLYALHDMIQDSVSFGRDHPFTFYTANSGSPWAERKWIADLEDWGRVIGSDNYNILLEYLLGSSDNPLIIISVDL